MRGALEAQVLRLGGPEIAASLDAFAAFLDQQAQNPPTHAQEPQPRAAPLAKATAEAKVEEATGTATGAATGAGEAAAAAEASEVEVALRPFTVCLDAPNIAYCRQNFDGGKFSFQQVAGLTGCSPVACV